MKRLALAMLLAVACRSPEPKPSAPAVGESTVARPAANLPDAAPLTFGPDASEPPSSSALAGSPLETWHADGFEIAASLPIGTHTKRPVVVGIHGSKDRHDLTCARWRRVFVGWAFIVCPQGVPYRGGLAWGAPSNMIERIDRSLAMLRERYGAWVADGPVVYAGWSLGATRGPSVVALRPGLFEPVVLAEVGHTRIDANASVSALRKAHVEHPIVACATNRCAQFVKRLQRAADGDRLRVGFVDAGIGRGHLFDELMAREIGTAIAHAIENDARWNGFASALSAPREDAGAPDEPGDEEDEPAP